MNIGGSFYNRAVQRKDYSDNTNSSGVYPVNAAVHDPVTRMKLFVISHFTNIVIVEMQLYIADINSGDEKLHFVRNYNN
jgi:hypothetical protein